MTQENPNDYLGKTKEIMMQNKSEFSYYTVTSLLLTLRLMSSAVCLQFSTDIAIYELLNAT